MKSALETPYWWKLIDDENGDFEKVFPSNKVDVLQNGIKIGEICQPNYLRGDWSFGQDFAAYAYELASRANRKLHLRKYPELTHGESLFLLRVFGERKARKIGALYVTSLDPAQPIESSDGFSQPVIFRLDAPDDTLMQAFRKFIKRQRELKNITRRQQPGETSKPPPWHYIENLDAMDLNGKNPTDFYAKKPTGETRVTDPQRDLRRARHNAKKYLQTFMAELKTEAQNNPRSRTFLWPELKF